MTVSFFIVRKEEEMGEEEEKNPEMDYRLKDGSIDLRALLTGLMQKFLGKSLDYARMSAMGDRSFTQFQRSLKDDFYVTLGYGLKILEDSGHIKPKDRESRG